MAGQHDAARARGRRTRVRARVLTWSRRRPGTVLPARLHLEHAARQAASEVLGQPGACCWPASDLGMVEHSCGESGGGDGRLVAPRSALVAASSSGATRGAALIQKPLGRHRATSRRRDGRLPTPLQVVACNPKTFRRGRNRRQRRNGRFGRGDTQRAPSGAAQVPAPRVGRGRNRASRPDRPLSQETSIAANKVYKRTPQSYTSHLPRAWEREKLGSIEHRPRVEPPAPPQATRRDSASDSPPHRSHAFQGTTIKSL